MKKEEIEKRIIELKGIYEHELENNGSKENASDKATVLHGEIRGLEWVIKFWEEGYYHTNIK